MRTSMKAIAVCALALLVVGCKQDERTSEEIAALRKEVALLREDIQKLVPRQSTGIKVAKLRDEKAMQRAAEAKRRAMERRAARMKVKSEERKMKSEERKVKSEK